MSSSPVGSLSIAVHARGAPSSPASADSGNGSETSQAQSAPATAGTGAGVSLRKTVDRSHSKARRRTAGPPTRTPNRPLSTGRRSVVTSTGVSRSPTYASARVPASTTRTRNQSSNGNATGAQKDSPW